MYRKRELLDRIPMEHREIFKLLKEHMNQTAVKDSAFNWVRPSLWTAVFGKSLKSVV